MSHREKKRKDADVIHDSSVKSGEVPKEPAREEKMGKKVNSAQFGKKEKNKKKRNYSEIEEARKMPSTKEKEFEEKDVINISDDSDETQREGVSTKQAKKENRGKKCKIAELDDTNSGSIEHRMKQDACQLSTNRRVTIKKSEGNILVDIREYSDRKGQPKRTKTGIKLTHDEWKVLKDNTDKIDQTILALG